METPDKNTNQGVVGVGIKIPEHYNSTTWEVDKNDLEVKYCHMTFFTVKMRSTGEMSFMWKGELGLIYEDRCKIFRCSWDKDDETGKIIFKALDQWGSKIEITWLAPTTLRGLIRLIATFENIKLPVPNNYFN